MEVKYDLKKPCADCPFRKDAKWHGGIFDEIPTLMKSHEAKTLAHTCHKTDPMSDSPEGQEYKGELQHCAGLLLMMHQNKRMMGNAQFGMWLKKQWDRNAMDTSIKVFKNLKEMGKRYAILGKHILKKRRLGNYHEFDSGLTIRFHTHREQDL